MLGGFVDCQYGRKAGVAPRGSRHPFVARSHGEDLCKTLAHFRPRPAIVLARKVSIIDAHYLHQIGIKMRLDRPSCDKLALFGSIGALEGRAAPRNLFPAPFCPPSFPPPGLKPPTQMPDPHPH